MSFIIEDEFGNHCFPKEEFKTFEDGWSFIYCRFPVIYNDDGTQDDQEDELDSYYVIENLTLN
jgi:hypothetical protein